MKYNISKLETRVYNTNDSCVFKKNNEAFGSLSNMSVGFPLTVNDTIIRTTEALYQACKFSHHPDIQKKIIIEHSPMKVKMISDFHKKDCREDWDYVKVKVMRWCLNLKFAQNILTFAEALNETGARSIVENSSKDNFWGAIPDHDGISLKGKNALGRLLMELRKKAQSSQWLELLYIKPPEIENFLLYSNRIGVIDERRNYLSSLIQYWCDQDPTFCSKNEELLFHSKRLAHSSNLGKDLFPKQRQLFDSKDEI